MSELIYLVGQISPKFEETYQWRVNIRDRFKGRKDIQFIDPCDNPFNQQVLHEKEYAISNDGRIEGGMEVLPPKDLTYILRCSIAIVNLNHYDLQKELLGSYFEMAWLYLHPEKTVIAFANNLNSYNCKHPFVSQSVHTWCRNEYEAAAILDKYFVENS